jgi:hypothetical protein
MGYDGLRGYSVISKARESIGLGLAAEKFGATFFGNGLWPGLVAVHPNTLTTEVVERMRKSWEALHQGSDKAHRLAVLEGGMKLERVTLNADDAQFLESREFQVEEIARWFGVPPHKIAHKYAERPGGSIEAQNIEFVVDSLRPWLVRIEQEIARKLIPYRERPAVYVEFLVDALLRGDIDTRYKAYAVGRQNGWLSVNEIRRFENMNPIGPEGDQYGTAAPAEQEPQDDDEPSTEREHPRPVDILAFRELFLDAMGRMVRAEVGAIRRLAARPERDLLPAVREFYEKHTPKVAAVLVPAVRATLAATGRSGDPEALARDEAARQCEAAVAALAGAAGPDAVEAILSRWEAERAGEFADRFLAGVPAAEASPTRIGMPDIVLPAPVVNVPPPVVRVEAPVVNVPAPVVNLPAPVVNVEVQQPEGRVRRESKRVIRDPGTNLITDVVTLTDWDG